MLAEISLESCIKANEQTLLKQSRSFAIPILQLDDRFRLPIMVQYNLNKTIDTIEDNPTLSVEERIQWIQAFVSALADGEYSEPLQQRMLTVTPADETFVFQNYEQTIALYKHLSPTEQQLNFRWTKVMADGMCASLQKPIQTFDDLNQYCYYVAGSVGIYLTEILALKGEHSTSFALESLKQQAIHFGLFLQKLNIIRDYREDKDCKQRQFWPSDLFEQHQDKLGVLNALCAETIEHDIPQAIDYVSNIPEGNTSYENFLRFILMSGLEYIKLLLNNPKIFSSQKIKLPRFFIKTLYSKLSRLSREVFVLRCKKIVEQLRCHSREGGNPEI